MRLIARQLSRRRTRNSIYQITAGGVAILAVYKSFMRAADRTFHIQQHMRAWGPLETSEKSSMHAEVKTLMFVCHPDDESIFGASALGPSTHVVVVTDANSNGSGSDRRTHLKNTMEITNTSWEMWDFPESRYHGPASCNGWSEKIQGDIVEKIRLLMTASSDITTIITHNVLGEYGHIDHINLHKAVLRAYMLTHAGSVSAPALKVFMPGLNYSNYENRLNAPPTSCAETTLHKSLLDSYEVQGSLSNAVIFRSLCYDVCSVSLENSALLWANSFGTCDALQQRTELRMTCAKQNAFEAPAQNYDQLVAEPIEDDAFWQQNQDRLFMSKFYPALGSFTAVLDIGARLYNRRMKKLVGSHTKYFQLEPFPPLELLNDGTLKCLVQDAIGKYPQFVRYFDAVVDFGVLGWPAVALDERDVSRYMQNIRALLNSEGIYILKVDAGGLERINLDEHISPYFNSVNFAGFESGLVLDQSGTKVFFFKSKYKSALRSSQQSAK